MRRLTFLDGLRGWFLLFMTLSHVILQGGVWLQHVHFRELMFVESAQGFIFLSGLMVGLVHGGKAVRKGMGVARRAILSRAGELYLWSVSMALAALCARALVPDGVAAWGSWIGNAELSDPLRFFAVTGLLFQPTFMDILPQYVIYMLFAPLALRLVLSGRWPLVLGLSAVVWFLGQISAFSFWSLPLGAMLSTTDGQGIRMSFDLAGWQILFFVGLVAGGMSASGQVDWSRVFSDQTRDLTLVALLIFVILLPLRVATAHDLMPERILHLFVPYEVRKQFSLVYLIEFAAVSWLAGWIMLHGGAHVSGTLGLLRRGIAGVVEVRAITLLGRHSLQVYAWHVLMIYALRYADFKLGPFTPIEKTLLVLATLSLLFVPALVLDRAREPRVCASQAGR